MTIDGQTNCGKAFFLIEKLTEKVQSEALAEYSQQDQNVASAKQES